MKFYYYCFRDARVFVLVCPPFFFMVEVNKQIFAWWRCVSTLAWFYTFPFFSPSNWKTNKHPLNTLYYSTRTPVNFISISFCVCLFVCTGILSHTHSLLNFTYISLLLAWLFALPFVFCLILFCFSSKKSMLIALIFGLFIVLDDTLVALSIQIALMYSNQICNVNMKIFSMYFSLDTYLIIMVLNCVYPQTFIRAARCILFMHLCNKHKCIPMKNRDPICLCLQRAFAFLLTMKREKKSINEPKGNRLMMMQLTLMHFNNQSKIKKKYLQPTNGWWQFST